MTALSRRRSRRPKLRDHDGKPVKAGPPFTEAVKAGPPLRGAVRAGPPLTEAVKAGPESPSQKLARRLAEYKVDRPDSAEMLRLLTERPFLPQPYPSLGSEEPTPTPAPMSAPPAPPPRAPASVAGRRLPHDRNEGGPRHVLAFLGEAGGRGDNGAGVRGVVAPQGAKKGRLAAAHLVGRRAGKREGGQETSGKQSC